jgi:hypothetical protein
LGAPSFKSSFAVGGFPEGSLFDLVGTNVAVLRGFPDQAYQGRNVLYTNAEIRVPLAHTQRGYRSLPVFLRSLHASLSADAAQAWSGELKFRNTNPSLGVSVGSDLFVGHQLPLTWIVGVAQGFGGKGELRAYSHLGLAF